MKSKLSFYGIINGLIRLLAAGAVFLLFLHSIFSTSYMGYITDANGNLQKHTRNIADQPWKHLIIFVLVTAVLWGCLRLFRRGKELGRIKFVEGKKFVKALCILTCVAGVSWIIVTQLTPGNDPAKVYAIAMQWRRGNFTSLAEGGYLFRYPFQSGIILFYYLLSFVVGTENYVALQMVNALALPLICYFLSKLTEDFWSDDAAFPAAAALGVCLWVPMLYYTTYLYGVLPGMAFAVAAVYLVMRYLKSGKIRYSIGAALCFGIAVVLKSNCLIYVVAMGCFLGYDAIDSLLHRGREEGKRWLLSLLTILLLVGGCAGFTKGYQKAVENISGYELSDGAAMVSWVVMGLQESPTGPGEYNGYIGDVFQKYHYDTAQIKEASVADIKKIIKRMCANPLDEGVTFFARKMAFQWNDPTFIAMERTQERKSAVTLPDYAQSLIDGQASVVLTVVLNMVQTLVWIGVLLYLFLRWKSRNLYELMGIVIFLGGYLFHFVWEAGASYTLPYFMVLIPYAVKGHLDLVRFLDGSYVQLRTGKLRWKRKRAVSIILGLVLTVLFIGLLTTTNLFYRTIALDDGEGAREAFWNRTAVSSEIKGWHAVKAGGNTDEYLTQKDGEALLTKADGQPETLLVEREDEGNYLLRFESNNEVLAVQRNVETEELSKRVLTYMEDDMNMFYQYDPQMCYLWKLVPVNRAENKFCIVLEEDALTWRDGQVSLESYTGAEDQCWIIE